MNNAFLFDNGAYNPDYLNMIINEASPKLKVLFEKIEKLDAQDLKKTGKLYKHFIFTDALNINFGVYNLTNQRIQYIQTYSGFHNPLPGMGREFLLKISYSIHHKK